MGKNIMLGIMAILLILAVMLDIRSVKRDIDYRYKILCLQDTIKAQRLELNQFADFRVDSTHIIWRNKYFIGKDND